MLQEDFKGQCPTIYRRRPNREEVRKDVRRHPPRDLSIYGRRFRMCHLQGPVL